MKLGPWASSETLASERGTPNRFFHHLSNCIVDVVAVVPADIVVVVVVNVTYVVAGVILSDVTTVIGAKVHV